MFNSYINGGYDCVICGSKTYLRPVCAKCRKSVFDVKSTLESNRCEKCGKVLVSGERICFGCREQALLYHVDLMLPLFSYRLWNKELMFLWKSKELRSFSSMFADVISDVLKMKSGNFEKLNSGNFVNDGVFDSSDVIVVPVPPRKGKILEKGWDQIEDLCLFLGYRHGFRILRVLQRNSTMQQKKLNREARLSHIQSAYSLKSESELRKILKPFSGKKPEEVWLIDDVCTTGSTIESCAKVLKEWGVQRVNVITLFIVD